MEENKENKKTKTIVVLFLLLVVIVSGLILINLYKSQAGKVSMGRVIRNF